MAPATIEMQTDTETALSDGALIEALVTQRRNRLDVELGDSTLRPVTMLTAVGDVLDELLDGGSVDGWRARAAVNLDRLGITGPVAAPAAAVG